MPTPEEIAFLQYQMSVQHETLQPNFYATIGVCIILAYMSVGLQLWVRHLKSQKLMADNWWIIGALVIPPRTLIHTASHVIIQLPTTLWDGFNLWSIHSGLGLHIIRVTATKAFIQSAVGCMILYA